jgi:small subunit ribosomal protein S21
MKHEKSPQAAIMVRNNNIDGALRVLKKKLQYEGIFNELRKREHFVSKGEKRRQAKKAGRRREQREIQKRLDEFGF